MKYISYIFRAFTQLLPLVAAAVMLAGCNGMIYDEEGDCDPHYKVRFVYDSNLKYSDAFAAEVDEVTLYIADSEGNIVWQKHESGDALKTGSYLMDVDGIEPGTYSLLAWCGKGYNSDFTAAETPSKHTHLQAVLNGRTEHDQGWDLDGHAVRDNFADLYHGKLANVEFTDNQGVHIFTVNLTKDTNDVHIVLQHLSGAPINADEFLFTIVEENGLLDWDNTILPDEPITYYAHNVTGGTAGVDVPDYMGDGEGNPSRVMTQVSCAVADFQISRLTPQKKCMVKIYRRSDHKLLVRIPIADYAIITKGEHHALSNEDYCDYRDDYSMVFFLDTKGDWISTNIYINSWHLIDQEVDPL